MASVGVRSCDTMRRYGIVTKTVSIESQIADKQKRVIKIKRNAIKLNSITLNTERFSLSSTSRRVLLYYTSLRDIRVIFSFPNVSRPTSAKPLKT